MPSTQNPASHWPDGTPRVYCDGKRVWHVATIWRAAEGLVPSAVEVSAIREMDEVCWFSEAWGKRPTCRAVGEHFRRVMAVDMRVPVIIGPDGGLLDGMHRVVRAWLDGRTTIEAVRLERMPEADEVLKAEDARYEA